MSPRRLAIAGLALALLAASEDARADGPTGWVRFVTARRAYLRAGRVDRLALGQTITLSRNGRPVGACTIDQLGDHQASCPIANARPGDSFTLPGPVQAPAVRAPVAQPSAAELTRAAQVLEATPVDKVDFAGAHTRSRMTASVLVGRVGQDAFVTVGGSSFEATRLELQLNGLDAHWAGFRVYAHLTAMIAAVRPLEQRFRPGDLAQVYLWEAAFSSREVGRPYVVSVGRISPYHTPGLVLLDGAQLGWRRKDGTAEVGVYGGLIPDAMTLYPSGDRYSAGVYFGYTLAKGGTSTLRLLQTDGRLGLRGAPGPGVQLELEWALMATIGSWLDLGVQARGSLGGGTWTLPSLDGAKVFASARPTSTVRLFGSFRYLDPKVEYDDLTLSLFDRRAMYDAGLTIAWDPRPWLALSLISGLDSAGGAQDATRGYVGPEVGLPLLFRGRGGIAVGYREELGWFVGRTVYAQLSGAVGSIFHAYGRLSYVEDRPGGGTSDLPYRELGAYFFAEGRILRWLSARLTALGRLNIDPSGEGLSPPGGVVIRAEVVGSL